jgi:hypothetical protein
VKRQHASLWLILGLSLGLGACGVGARQTPVSTDGELGTTQAVSVEEDKPTAYTTRSGDTLADVAGRPEIYGDPALWPLVQGENSELVAGKGAHEALEGGIVLQIPRGVSPEAMEQAREQARQAQAASKQETARREAASSPKKAKKAKAAKAATVHHAKAAKRAAKAEKHGKQAKPAVAAAPAPTEVAAQPTPAPAPAPVKHGGGLRPLLLLLLLVLLALGAVLWAFSRRDSNDGV